MAASILSLYYLQQTDIPDYICHTIVFNFFIMVGSKVPYLWCGEGVYVNVILGNFN